MIDSICIAGAGTMGSGIAQVAAQSGYKTILFDLNTEVLGKARAAIEVNLQHLVDRQKIQETEKTAIFQRVQFSNNINDCIADVVIEAIIEKIEPKIALFGQLTTINKNETIFASNTSSLSISAIQEAILYPERVIGMHFFNPAPIMKLVEVVAGNKTSDQTIQTIEVLCTQMGKTAVICKDAPGFIVNRVARHYYLEAMKIVEQEVANIADVDAVMEANGFKMGPFRLMDLIGMDINLAVSQSIYEALDHEIRFRPSILQTEKVAKAELGRKTGKGFYEY